MLWFVTVIVILCAAYVAWRWFRPRRLPPAAKRMIVTQWQSAQSQSDPHRRLLEADSVVAHLLDALGFSGSMGDKLRAAKNLVPGLNDVWAAHKLRNRIAHEPGLKMTDADVNRALQAFGRVIAKYT